MQVISVDDERLALEDLRDICLSLPQVTDFQAFSNPADALEHAATHKTFGYYDVFVQNKPVYFSSGKAKELLALLVDRRGGSVSTENAISMLWPNRDYDETVQSLFRKVLKSLRVSLSDAGISDILIDVRNQRSVDTEKFTCDLYACLQKDKAAMESYLGEYMQGYPWAQRTKQHLDTICGR